MRNKLQNKLTKKIYIIASFVLVFAFIGGYITLKNSRAETVSGVIADIDGNSAVNILDLSKLISNFMKSLPGYGQGDLDNNGRVDIYDLSILLAHFGKVVYEKPPEATQKLYVNPYKQVSDYVYGSGYAAWRANHPTETAFLKKIADQPSSIWLGYSTDNTVLTQALSQSATNNTIPVFVLYAIPYRDNGQYASAGGGKGSAQEYRNWVDWIASKNGSRESIFIIEPDAVAMSIGDKPATATSPARTSAEIMAERYSLITYAANKLNSLTNAKVYIDMGNSGWGHTAETIAGRLNKAGIDKADGMSTNVSNFRYTSDEVTFGNKVSAMVGNKPFVIDTSRNGNGPRPRPSDGSNPPGEYYWCNPPGRALGNRPTLTTGVPNVDAFLWVKGPGGIDGPCNGAPTTTNFWVEYAIGLAKNAPW